MKCTGHSSQTGKPCQNYPMHGSTVCSSHGGKAPQVMRAAELRLAEARDDALELMAVRLKYNVAEVVKKDGVTEGSIEYRDLLATVDKFTTLAELLAGRATDRVAITDAQGWVHAVFVVAERFVLPDKRAEFLQALAEVQTGEQRELAA
jgi:hypothetical protein